MHMRIRGTYVKNVAPADAIPVQHQRRVVSMPRLGLSTGVAVPPNLEIEKKRVVSTSSRKNPILGKSRRLHPYLSDVHPVLLAHSPEHEAKSSASLHQDAFRPNSPSKTQINHSHERVCLLLSHRRRRRQTRGYHWCQSHFCGILLRLSWSRVLHDLKFLLAFQPETRFEIGRICGDRRPIGGVRRRDALDDLASVPICWICFDVVVSCCRWPSDRCRFSTVDVDGGAAASFLCSPFNQTSCFAKRSALTNVSLCERYYRRLLLSTTSHAI